MVTPSDQPAISAQARTCQIIIGALAMSVSMFLVIVFVLRSQQQRPPAGETILTTYLMWPMTVLCFAGSYILGMLMTSSARRSIAKGSWQPPRGSTVANDSPSDAVKLSGIYLTQMIVRAAMIEGAAFFAAICYLLEGASYALALAAVLTVMLTLHFPTSRQIEQWINSRLEEIAQDRQMIT